MLGLGEFQLSACGGALVGGGGLGEVLFGLGDRLFRAEDRASGGALLGLLECGGGGRDGVLGLGEAVLGVAELVGGVGGGAVGEVLPVG